MKRFYSYHTAPVCIAIVLQCLACRALAQPVYHFENLTEANGLSDNRVTCFLKDRTGFMWIGTENGLNRFDGHSFLVYQPGKPGLSISDIFINDIEQDSQGRLWVATASGLNMIDTEKDSTHIFVSEKKDDIPSDWVWDTYVDLHDRVWIATDNRDLCFYDSRKDAFTYIHWIKYISSFFPDRQNKYNSIRKIFYKSNDELWLGTTDGLFSYRISTGQFSYHQSFATDHFMQLETAPNGSMVYYTQNPVPAFEVLNLETGLKKDIPWQDIPVTTPDHQRNTDCNNYRWLPAGKNIVEINTVSGEALIITHKADDPYSLPDGIVKTIYRDNTGLVWVATSNGVGRFNPCMNLFPFTKVFSPTKENTMEENDFFRYNHRIHTIFYSRPDDKYYIGSPATNSLIIKDRTSGATEIITSVQGIPLKRCSVIFEDSKGMLWILAGINAFCYDRARRRFTVSAFRAEKRVIFFTDMAEDQDGNFWIAAYGDGLYRYNAQNNTNIKYDERNGLSKLPTSLYFDKAKNNVIVGSFGYGAFKFDTKQMRFSRFMKQIHSVDKTKHSMITDVAVDKKGTLWMACFANGVARVDNYSDSSTLQMRFITTQDGLPENNMYALQPDHADNMWAAGYQGITRIDAAGKVIVNYNRKTGLHFTNFYSPFTLTPDGEMLTGIGDGFIRFRPDSLHWASPAFPVVITAIRSKDDTEKNTFSYSNNEIQFDFAALSYVKPDQVRYEYRLEGFDKHWVNAGNTTTMRYNNLMPGSYVFKVRAVDFTGKQSSNTAAWSFRIRPPWWRTWWFRIGVALTIIITAYLLFRQRIQSIQNKAKVRGQMSELQAKALRAQMNPHFIFNCLNAIQELIVREKYDDAYKYLSKFSRLLRMVLDMSDKTLIPLGSEIEMCRLYLELESMRFKHSFEYSILADPGIDTETVMVPSMLMQPFIENAIWHGLLQKDGEKNLSVRFEEQQGRLVCIIHDNGIGRKKSADIRARKIGSQHLDSKGIELTRQRIENLAAAGSQRATIEIKDCTDENGNASGTMVQITISQSENNQAW